MSKSDPWGCTGFSQYETEPTQRSYHSLIKRLSSFLTGLITSRSPVVIGVCIVAICVCMGACSLISGGSSTGFTLSQVDDESDAITASLDESTSVSIDETKAEIYVHISGAVEAPGLYVVEEGSRLDAVISAAGGFTADAACDAINRARVVSDGEHVIVPTLDEISQGNATVDDSGIALSDASSTTSETSTSNSTVSTSSASTNSGKVNINTATSEELQTLPKIGETRAQNIIADREANGPFQSIEDIMRISGIGEGIFNGLKDQICVS